MPRQPRRHLLELAVVPNGALLVVDDDHRPLSLEWAYAHTYTSQTQREPAYQTWLHHYNHHRPHTALDGQTPANRVHTLTGKYT